MTRTPPGRGRGGPRPVPGAGFTLLELLISCMLLVTVLAVLSLVISRVQSLRSAGIRRTTVLTRGRAALDIIADDLENVIGDNLEVLAGDVVSYGATNTVLRLVRALPLPRAAEAGGASNPPLATVCYQVAATNIQGLETYHLLRSRTNHVARSDLVLTNTGVRLLRVHAPDGGSYDITNVVPGSGRTILPRAQAGDTILLPFNTYSSDHIHDWETSSGAWLDVEPTADTNFNRVVATAVLTNRFSWLDVHTNWPAAANLPAGAWPSTSVTTFSTGYQAVSMIVTPAIPGASALFLGTPAGGLTNIVVPPACPVTFTNEWRVTCSQDGGLPQPTNSFCGVLLDHTNLPPAVVSNAWTLPPDNSRVAGIRCAGAWRDWAAWDSTVVPLPALSNMPWRIAATTNVSSFAFGGAPFATPPLPELPLALVTTGVFAFATGAESFETLHTRDTVVLAHGETPAPIRTQVHWRAAGTIATNMTAADRQAITIRQRLAQVATNIIETWVPASLIATGRYYRAGDRATREWVDTITDVHTIWTPYTLTESYEGGPADIFSLWLDPGTRVARGYRFETVDITDWQGRPPVMRAGAPDEIVEGVAAIYFQPLCFRRDSDSEPWRLEPWGPDDDEPPVCVDIYLELLDPSVARRAAAMRDERRRQEFVARNVVRLTRRAALRPHNRWGTP